MSENEFYRVNADGGIVAPPGQSAGEGSIGVVLTAPDGSVIHEISTRIGHVPDHHVAEYRALISGLQLARGHGIDPLRVYMDSGVVVGQVNGKSSVKPDLLPYLRRALILADQFTDLEVIQVNRRDNKNAHMLADAALADLRSRQQPR